MTKIRKFHISIVDACELASHATSGLHIDIAIAIAIAFKMHHIVMFTKYPIAGYAKTRLIPALGAEGAATVSRQLTERCMRTIASYVSQDASRDTLIRVYYTGDGCTELKMRTCLGDGDSENSNVEYIPQVDGDLGARLSVAVSSSFTSGCNGMVIVGTDIPELSKHDIRDAFTSLDENDVVLGPAADGGYYLIALRDAYLVLFRGVAWSTSGVLSQTLSIAAAHGLKVRLLRELRDVDEPGDVEYVRRFVSVPDPVATPVAKPGT